MGGGQRIDWMRRALWLAVGGTALLLALAVLLVPYHLWDAFSFGTWSVAIAGGEPLGNDPATAVLRQRPLFYWLQGGLWAVLGVDERAARLLAAGFFVLLAGSLHRLARRGDRTLIAGPLALALLLMSPEAVALAASGLSDVPAAAMVGATGALALTPGGRRRIPLLVVMAAATGLTKPSVFPALAGLALATLIGPREAIGDRLRDRVAPLTAGVAAAVAYLAWQGHVIGVGLFDVLDAGNAGLHSSSTCDASGCEQVGQLASRVRLGATVELLWMGTFLRPFLAFALVYTALRLAGRQGRETFLIGAAAAFLLPWLGAIVSTGSLRSGPLTSAAAVAYSVACSAVLALGALAPAAVPARRDLARMAVWALPSVVVWLVLAPFGPRLLAPAWPALLTLTALAVAPAVAAAAARGRLTAAACTLVLCGTVALNVRDLDALDAIAPRRGGSLAVIADLLRDPLMGDERARALVEPELTGELAALRPLLAERGSVITSDRRMPFFFPHRVEHGHPAGCADLAGHAALLLLTNPVSRSQAPGGTGDPRWWPANCPGMRLVAEVPGRYAVIAVPHP